VSGKEALWCLLHARLFSAISIGESSSGSAVRNLNRLIWLPCLALWCIGGVFPLGVCSSAPASDHRAAAQMRGAATMARLDIIPAPARVAPRRGSFVFRPDTSVAIAYADASAARVARYLVDLLHDTAGVHLRIVERPDGAALPAGAVVLQLGEQVSNAQAPNPSPESYAIDIAPARVVLSAGDPRGLFYAAVTLWELCTATGNPRSGSITLQAAHIDDRPRLAWRGLMLDSARHFQSPQFIMRYIDWMALHKLNVLHWHLTDDQGWRLEIERYPRLTSIGAWRVPAGPASAADIDPATGRPRLYGGFYTQDEVRRIVAHAAERNVTIIPEIDMPGHASAAIAAYPELGVTDHPPVAVPADWGLYPNLYNVEESTFTFIENVLDEVIALFPGEYVHVGGDEAVKGQWKASPRVQARMRELHVADEQTLQSYFVERIEKHLRAHGRRLIGWDEILEGGIAERATVMSWRGLEGAVTAVGAGHDAVLSPWPTLYFDNRQGAGKDEPPGRGQVISLRQVYDFDPVPGSIPVDQRQHILGLQANVWTEHIRTEDRVAYMTFPRAAAVAEVGWTPPERHDWESFLHRLPSQFARYRSLGLRYSDDALRPEAAPAGPFDVHASQELRTCTDKLVLSLEDDAPIQGNRAVFLIDLMNPCWIFPSADLSRGPTLQVAVGQVPFNFQIGKDRDSIRLATPQNPEGELQVHLDGCEGPRIAVLPLAPAVKNDAVTQLPPLRLPPVDGRHDLCFRFAQRSLDPLWALDWIQLRE
jgi:hexosaminidase